MERQLRYDERCEPVTASAHNASGSVVHFPPSRFPPRGGQRHMGSFNAVFVAALLTIVPLLTVSSLQHHQLAL